MVKVNTRGKGLGIVFPQKYKCVLMAWLLGNPKLRVKSRRAWEYVNEQIAPETVSRASVINFLNDEGVDEGYLQYDEDTGKGGFHRVYNAKMDIDGFWRYVSEEVTHALAPFLTGQA